MLEYFGVKGATCCAEAGEQIKEQLILELDRNRGIDLVIKVRLLSTLTKDKITPLSVLYIASKTTYAKMKDILDVLERDGMVSSKLYVRGAKQVATKQYLLTEEGEKYVKQYDTEDCKRLPGTRKRGAPRTG